MTKLNLFSFSILAVVSFLFLAGCDSEMGTPEIMGHDSISIIKSEPIPTVPELRKPARVSSNSAPWAWYPPKGVEKNWKAIMIHHSATQNGNAAIIDDWHRNGNHWKGIGYDFVVCNGKSDGLVEVTFRWKEQIPGAHVGGTPNNWANVDGIGICLIGDFSKRAPSQKQMASLTKLVRFLQKRYRISNSKVYGHNTTPGASGTECPGKYFPMSQFKRSL